MNDATTSAARGGRPITGRFVLICLVVFFGVIIGINLLMMKLAIETLPGTEVDSPYAASLAYGSEIEAARAQRARGWAVTAHVVRASDGSASLRVEARDRDSRPLSGVVFTARLERPADRRADQAVVLVAAGGAQYRGQIAQIAAGQWDVVLQGDRNGERVFLSRNRIVLN